MTSVLYIEDDPANRRLMQALFKRLQGFTLAVVEDAETGLVYLADHDPDIVLMDIKLPGMNGFEALKQIRKMKNRHAKVFAITANAMHTDSDAGMYSEFDNYLIKPISINDIVLMLHG
jgi:CheY-like chemotaxis protein